MAGGLIALSGAQQQTPPVSVINRYCIGCHNSKLNTAGLALDALSPEKVNHHPEAWEKVVRKLRARYMPPAGLPRPDERAYGALVSELETSLDSAAAAKPNPGRTDTFRRLNRTEYQNAIRDLLAVDVDVDLAVCPSDESSHGFDNVTVGDLSPTLLERYLSAAQKISRLAIGIPSRSPGGDTITLPPDLTQEEHFDELPLGTRGGTVVRYTFPLDAEYEFQLRLARDRNEHVEGLREPHEVELMLDGERARLFTVKPPPQARIISTVDKDLNIRIPVKAGPHVVAVAFPKKPSRCLKPSVSPTRRTSTWTGILESSRLSTRFPSTVLMRRKVPATRPAAARIFVCKPAKPSEEEGCAKRILAT